MACHAGPRNAGRCACPIPRNRVRRANGPRLPQPPQADHPAVTPRQAGTTAVGVFFPVIATIFYLAVSVLFLVEPLRHLNLRRRRAAQPGPGR